MHERGMKESASASASFSAAVETTVTAILQNPLAYPRVKGDPRRALVRRFPYAVYFRPIAARPTLPHNHARAPNNSASASDRPGVREHLESWRDPSVPHASGMNKT